MSLPLLRRELRANYKMILLFLAVITLYSTVIIAMYDPKLGASLSDPLQMYLSDIYTVSVNLAGLPGISVPCGFDAKGMPIGAQLIGPALGEAKVLNAAHAFQLDTDYHRQSPARKEAQAK